MRYYIGVTTENDRTSLTHSPKGTTWKNHKYLRKEGGRYVYSEGKTTKLSSMKKRKNSNSTGEMVGDSQHGGYLPDTIPKKVKKKECYPEGSRLYLRQNPFSYLWRYYSEKRNHTKQTVEQSDCFRKRCSGQVGKCKEKEEKETNAQLRQW